MDAAGDPDLVVTLGGDGTFLRGARLRRRTTPWPRAWTWAAPDSRPRSPNPAVRSALDAVRGGHLEPETRMLLTLRASRTLEIPTEMEALTRYRRGPLPPPDADRAGLPRERP